MKAIMAQSIRRSLILPSSIFTVFLCLTCGGARPIAEPTPQTEISALPRFRGFNLLEKFTANDNRPYREEDFKYIAELGFNFVRLPLDYRCFTYESDPRRLRERVMREIDQAVDYGRRYGIHVSLNFHRAPGYCVNPPPEKTSLWEDEHTQETFAVLWALFADRYRGVPNQSLSFNLINEPGDIDGETYSRIMSKAINAIREKDPNRLVIIDGLKWGTRPASGLHDPLIIQAARGYAPFELTHYRASWVEGSEQFPVPSWPIYETFSAYLYGPQKSEFSSPLVIRVDVKNATRLFVTVQQVSALSRLVVKADGKTVFDKRFVPGPGEGEWEKVVFEKQWNIYQNIYNKRFAVSIPAGTNEIAIENIEGDWFLIPEITLEPYSAEVKKNIVLSPGSMTWGLKQGTVRLSPDGRIRPDNQKILFDHELLQREYLAPWLRAKAQGTPVLVGEFGAFNQTPHQVTLAWMEDFLKILKEENIGWALWNFRGSFGVLDSERKDVVYTDFHGHKLDKEMLDLLLRY